MLTTGICTPRRRAGFSLIELLLTVVLLMLLAGASIYSFSSLRAGADLDEGVDRLETLFRHARAHAANTGRQVQVIFEPAAGTQAHPARLRVLFERDPLGSPGEFAELTGLGWTRDDLAELIAIESISGITANRRNAVLDWMDVQADFSEVMVVTADRVRPVTFFPDGSSDSVEVVVLSRNETDRRRMAIRLIGITGSILREELPAAERGGDFGREARELRVSSGAEGTANR